MMTILMKNDDVDDEDIDDDCDDDAVNVDYGDDVTTMMT